MQKIFDKLHLESLIKAQKSQVTIKYLKYAALFVGTYKLCGFACCSLSRFFNHYLLPQPDLLKRYGKCHVVISGGSSGLGKEYAKQFARMGFNLILLARGLKNLEETKAEIIDLFPKKATDIQLIEFDFTNQNEAAYDKLIDKITDFPVGILINNVGTFTMDLLPDLSHDKVVQLMSINMFAQTLLTQKMIPSIRARGKRSAIFFIGSEAGDYPRSRFSIYAATKAFGNQLARSLEIDLRNTNIDIRLFVPGPTMTPLLNLAAPDYPKTVDGRFFICQPKDVVSQHVRKCLAYKEVWGTLSHGVLHTVLRHFRGFYDYLKGE